MKFIDKFSVMKSVLLSILLMLFVVQVNAQKYAPASGAGSNGPVFNSGSFQVCILGQTAEYSFTESNYPNLLGTRFSYRIDSGSIFADPLKDGATLTQNIPSTVGSTHYYDVVNSTSIGASSAGWQGRFGSVGVNRTIQIKWYTPGTYTLYVSRYGASSIDGGAPFSYAAAASHSDRWTAIVITVGAGTPPVMNFAVIAPSSICSGETATISLYADPLVSPPSGYRFHVANDSSKMSLIGFPQDTVIDVQMITGNNTLTLDRLVNTSDTLEKIEIHITPLGGAPVGTTCDGKNDTLFLFVHPQVINPDIDILVCKGVDVNIADMVDSVKNAKVTYEYAFYSDLAGTIPVTSLLINNILKDTTFYVEAIDPRFSCGTNRIATLAITAEYQAALPTFSKDTNVCIDLTATVDLTSLVNAVSSNTYNYFENDGITPVANPTQVGPFTKQGDVTYYVQAIEADGCLSKLAPIVIHPVPIPAVTVTPNTTVYGDTLLFYRKNVETPKFEITRTDGGLTDDWTYTVNGNENSATESPDTLSFPIFTNNAVFLLTEVSSEGCVSDDTIRFILRTMPDILVTRSYTSCSDVEAEVVPGDDDTTTICQGDKLYLCVLPTDINSDEGWRFSYTFTGISNTTAEGISYNVPYSMYEQAQSTDDLVPGAYVFTISELQVNGESIPNPPGYITNAQIDFKHTIEIVEKLNVTIDGDREATGPICSNVGFNLPVSIAGGKDTLTLTYTVNGVSADTGFRLPIDGGIVHLPIQGRQAGDTIKVRLESITSEPCTYLLDSTYIFVVDTLPVPTIPDLEAGLCLRENTIVTYTTQKGMTNYVWEIAPSQGYTIENENESNNDDSLKVKWTAIGEYTIFLSYTDGNGCTNSSPIENTVTVYPVPSADLVLERDSLEGLTFDGDTLLICADYDLYFRLDNIQGMLIDDIFGEYDMYVAVKVTGENDTVILPHYFYDPKLKLHLGNQGLIKPGIYAVTIDTIIDMLQPMTCPGKGNDTTYIRVLAPPTATIKGTEPTPICDRNNFEVEIDITGGQADWEVYYSYTYIYGGTPQLGSVVFESGTAYKFPIFAEANKDTNSFVIVSLDSIKAPNCPMIQKLDIDTFELKPLPVPTITVVDRDTDTACRLETVLYATETGMEGYKWSIEPTSGYKIIDNSDTTEILEVKWEVPGNYTISIVYTDTNGCENQESTDSIITILEIPSAALALVSPKDNCPGSDIKLALSLTNALTEGPWKVVYSAYNYKGVKVETYTVEDASLTNDTLIAGGLPAGKYTFRVDTIIELTTAALCAGIENPHSDTAFIYPEMEVELAAIPNPVCLNELSFFIQITPNPSLFTENDSIPHYTGYKFWVSTKGYKYPVGEFSWTTDPQDKIFIPDTALEVGFQKFVISHAEVTIGNDLFCAFNNVDSITVEVKALPVVKIEGDAVACETKLSGESYDYTSQESLMEYLWSTEAKPGTATTGVSTIVGDNNEKDVNITFSDTGYYNIYLKAKDDYCWNYDTLEVYVAPHPRLKDIDSVLTNTNYVNCETLEFAIGSVAGCRENQLGKVMIVMDTTGLLIEYYEANGANAGQWFPLNPAFVNDTALYGPATGFPIVNFDNPGSKFRVTSTSAVRVEPVNYEFVIVDAADGRTQWSEPLKGSFILTPTTNAEIASLTLDSNAIVNCEGTEFSVEITPNCQEGDTARLRIDLANPADAADIALQYSFDNENFNYVDASLIVQVDSLLAGQGVAVSDTLSTVYFKIWSRNTNDARDVVYNLYLEDKEGNNIWDSIMNYRIRLVENAPVEFAMIQELDGNNILCFEDTIQIAFAPNCLLSDDESAMLAITVDADITDTAVVYFEGTELSFTNNVAFLPTAWPGLLNNYTDTLMLTLRSINPSTTDVNRTFNFILVDVASDENDLDTINDINTGNFVPVITRNWTIIGKPVAPIFTPDTVAYCQTHATWVNFPASDNLPTNAVNVWENEDGQTVTNASIAVYGVYDYFSQHLDTTTGCYSDETRFVIDVMSDPNVLRMTSFVYCKNQTAQTFKFHDYFTENNPDVRYEYRRILDQTWYDTTHYPYNGFDSIPSFLAVNNGVDPIIVSYKLIAHDPSATTCNSGRDEAYFTITINPVPAIPTVVSDQVYCNGRQVAKDDSPFPANNAQYTYDWIRRAGGDTIFANMADTGSGSFAFTAINNTNKVISDTFTIRPRFTHSHEACGVDTANLVISILPTPSVNSINQLTVCAGKKVDSIGFGGIATKYNWVKLANGDNVGLDTIATSGKDTIPAFIANPNALSTLQATYRITPVIEHNGSSCEGNTMDFTITVLPRAIVNPIDSQVICSNTAITPIAFTGTVGASFQWKNIGDHITGLPTGLRTENGIAAYTLINNTDAVQRAKIRVYASNNTCTGDSTDFTIVVYPQPTVKTVNNLTLCANDILATIKFESSPASVSTSFSWRNIGASIIGLPANGTDSIPTDTLRNTGSTPLTATIEVTPKNNKGLCTGLPMTFNITVNPEPTVTNIPMDYELCNGGRTLPILFEGSATSYLWEATARTTNTSGFPTGVKTGAFGTYTITNSGVTVDTVTVVVTPKVGICEGTPDTFNIIVHPTPSIANTFTDVTICSGAEYPEVKINSVGTVTWTVTGDQISGLPSNGTVGSDSLFGGWPLTNNTNAVRSAIVTLNTSVSGNCAATPVTFIINVNPNPTLTNTPSNATLCSGDTYQQVGFTGNATAYDWAVTNAGSITGFTATSGSGAFGPFTLTNTTTNPITATVKVTPKYGACPGDTGKFTITVNPEPKVTTTTLTNQVVCSGATFAQTNFTGTPATGVTYNWAITGDNISGLPAIKTGTSFIPACTLTNTTNQPQMVTITVTPTITGTVCTGTPISYTITVNPAPTLANKPSNLTLCSGDVYPAISFIGNANAFDWTVTPNGITGFVPTSGSNVFGPFTLTNTGNMTATATVTVTPKYDACAASAETFTITVNPMPTIGRILSDTVICHNKSVSYNFGANAEWIATGDMITGLPASGQGNLNATLENRGTTALTAVIIVTPKSATCIGTPERFTITVNPNPVVDNVPADYTICNNTATTPFTFTGVATEYEWTVSGNANIAGFPTGTQTGHFGTYMLSHTQSTPQTATITVKPKYNNGGTNCDGTGAGLSFKITVNPSAEITNTLNDLPLCDGQSTGTITFAGATDYEWIITGDRISGLPTGVQTGNFGPYTVSNTGNVALNATVTVTPRYIAGGVNCAGTSKSFDIVVNPSTVVTSAGIVANKTNFCVGETMLLSLEATGVNLTYEWYKDGSLVSTSEEYEVAEVGLDASGDYHVIVKGACGNITSEIVTITVGSGDMLLEKWHDIIHVDNYAQLYTGYQWYKDGKKLEGATKQFYHEPGGLKGCYYVVLTLASGGTETSCEKCYDNTKLATKDWKLTVYPNPSKQGTNATGILLSNDDVKYDGSLNVTIHNMNGAEVVRMNKVEGKFDMETIQLAPGVYNVRVVTEEGKAYNEKLIVY